MYIAYIYDWDNIIAQVDTILDFQVEQKLNDTHTASFTVHHTNPYCKKEYLEKYRRVKIKKLINWEEKTFFDWIIRGFRMDLKKVEVKLASFGYLVYRRLIHQDYNFDNKSIDNILSTILNDINSIYDTWISLDCWITTTTTKKYTTWQNFLYILKDLAKTWNYEFIIENKVLKFKPTIWQDRTTWINYVEYRYNYEDPEDRTIDRIQIDDDWNELTNWVLAKDWTNTINKEDTNSKNTYWLIEHYAIWSWDLDTIAQEYLDLHKQWLKEYNLTASSNDFFEVNIWDLVKVYLNTWNDMLYYNWPMKIVRKRFKAGDLDKIEISLSVNKEKLKDFLEDFKNLKDRVQNLEI